MKSKKHFPVEIVKRIHADRILGIRAGTKSKHRIIGIWAVVVDGRVYVRSYQRKTGGWWRTLVDEPLGEIFVAKRKRGIKVRAVKVKSGKLKDAVSAAYREKYNTPGSIGYVAEMSRSPSRDATMELTAIAPDG
jgi:hypothetical protein